MNPRYMVGRIWRYFLYAPRTQRIIWVCTLFLAGLLSGPQVSLDISIIVLIVLLGLIALVHQPRSWLLLAIVLAFVGGYIRGNFVASELAVWRGLDSQKVSVVVRALEDSDVGFRSQLEFDADEVLIERDGELVPIAGVIKVQGYGVSSVRRGDVVRAKGKAREAWGNREAQISFSELDVIAHTGSTIETVRREFFAGTYNAIPEPHASLGLGFLVGMKAVLPDELLDQLGRTGLTHIVAVSGYNLTILVRAMRRGFAKQSKFLALFLSVSLIASFIAVTGVSPSIFRAAVVSGLALATWYYGRNVKPMILLGIAAAVTAGINPTYLWRDIGWYLSFLAFFGVLVLAPLITKRIFAEREPHWMVQILIETTSAQLLVLPLIAVIFGEVSLISLLANLIVLPLIPFAMLATFVAGIFGALAPALASWVALPATYILGFIITVVRLLGGLSWASVSTEMNWWHGSLLYSSILIILLTLRLKVGKIRDYNVIE